ncbi:helix-turn-helix transcriptional regulator [Bacillus sp. FJAT-50079]|uniref:helix-turn-helix transcriptional regulator n=1 Tax=Bacillus sp. FJAT-50079 TaxID=2833577 RepID=UPI001BC8FA98|nr:helix-turn-helix transcriptional regulator [Bacillus sp. FJAT-50079]MBS4207141.1 helix-turn-helix transcriptional regulator [Bacillus sp. FJAT-50079]
MSTELSYTVEEVSQLLKVSKLTIYDLVKKGDLPVFRVGRQMRIDAKDLENYIQTTKTNRSKVVPSPMAQPSHVAPKFSAIVISGQDLVLDVLGKHVEKNSAYQALRSYTGSLNSLISMYNGDVDIVSLHLFDGDSDEYNLPYVKKILVGQPYIVLNLISRQAGLYVQRGNPLNIQSWMDMKRKQVKLVNREKGSGARILLDEQLRINDISAQSIDGYHHIETSHLSVASAVSTGAANVGVGIEKAAKIVGIDFIPLITERYDLVILKTDENKQLIQNVKDILSSEPFQTEINSLGDYNLSQMGQIMHETF